MITSSRKNPPADKRNQMFAFTLMRWTQPLRDGFIRVMVNDTLIKTKKEILQ